MPRCSPANAGLPALQRSLGNRVVAQLARGESVRAAAPPGHRPTVQRVEAKTQDEREVLGQLQQMIDAVYGPPTRSRARYDGEWWVDELAAALAPKLKSWRDVALLTEVLAGKSPSVARQMIDLHLRQRTSPADPRAAGEIDRATGEEKGDESEKESEFGSADRGVGGLAAAELPAHGRGGPDQLGLGGAPVSRSSQAILGALAFIRQAADLTAELHHVEQCGWPDAATPVRVVVWELQRARVAVMAFVAAVATWRQSGELDASPEYGGLVTRSEELYECLHAVNAAHAKLLEGLRGWLEQTAKAELFARKHDLLGALLLLETVTLGVATGLGWVSLFVFPPAALAALALALGTLAVTGIVRRLAVAAPTEQDIRRHGGRTREEPRGGLTLFAWGIEGAGQTVNTLGMTAKLSSTTMGFVLGAPLAAAGTGVNAYNYMCTVAAASPSLKLRPLSEAGHRHLRAALERVFAPASETEPFPIALTPSGLLVLTSGDGQTLVGWDGRVSFVEQPSASRE